MNMCIMYMYHIASRLISLDANFLNFTNGLTTWEIYSGLLHEVRLLVTIAEIGTDVIMSR